MLFTRESDYAVRIVRALKDGGRLNIKTICEKEDIPEAFGYKILKKLANAGVISITRGAMGGYSLQKPVTELTLYDVIVSVEPDFAVMECIHHFCKRYGQGNLCKVHAELVGIQKMVEDLLKQKKLAEILE